MAAASESNDASDIFWPGYVDAVTNLAINLLFVIAVMSIVVLTSVLQMAKLKPDNYVPKTPMSNQNKTTSSDPSMALAMVQREMLENTTQVKTAIEKFKMAVKKSSDEKKEKNASADAFRTPASAIKEPAIEPAYQQLLEALEQSNQKLSSKQMMSALTQKPTDTKSQEQVTKTQEDDKNKGAPSDPNDRLAEIQQELIDDAVKVKKSIEKYKSAVVKNSGENKEKDAFAAFSRTAKSKTKDAATDQALKELLAAYEQTIHESNPQNLKQLIAQKVSNDQEQLIKKLQQELQLLKTGIAKQKSEQIAMAESGGTGGVNDKADVVNAKQKKQVAQLGTSQLQILNAGGLVVVFDKDVIELSDKEAAELVEKIGLNAGPPVGQWLIQVFTPKGFSESTRLAYYRVNNIRSILLKKGVLAASIDLRVTESEGSGANNARILVRPVKP